MKDSGVFDVDSLFSNGYEKNDNIEIDLLDRLDSYLEDIDERLTVSRMVSDSVIKGMVNAVTEEAAESIQVLESEVVSLSERLDWYESSQCRVKSGESFIRHDSGEECLGKTQDVMEKQFRILEKKIEDVKLGRFVRGQSKLEESEKWEKWAVVDRTLSDLRDIVSTVCAKVDRKGCDSNTSLFEQQKEREFRDEIEAMVIRVSIRSFQEEGEVHLWERRAQFSGIQTTNQLARVDQLSSLRQELNSLSRILSTPEMGQIPSNGSHDGSEECNNGKRKDHFLRKEYSNQFLLTNSIKETNGEHEDFKIAMPEILGSALLNDKSKEELISYFKGEMTKMKRNHESLLQEKIEEYYSLRREFLKERGPLFSLRREKEFEAFRKKIPEVIVKLDSMLVENEKLPLLHENNETTCKLKSRIDTLLSENNQLKDLLTSKSKEVKSLSAQVSSVADTACNLKSRIDTLLSENNQLKDSLASKSKEVKSLSSQLSGAEDRMSHHSLAETKLLKQIMKLKCNLEDLRIEVSIRDDVSTCIQKELIDKTNWAIQNSDMESMAILEIYELIFRGFAMDAKSTLNCDIQDSDIESIIMQEICVVIFREAAKDAESSIYHMRMKYDEANEQRVFLEASLLESEKDLSTEIEEKEQLKQQVLELSALVEEKEKMAQEKGSLLIKEREQYVEEFNLLRSQVSHKENLVSENRSQTYMVMSKLEVALRKIALYEADKAKLDQELAQAREDLKGANEELKILNGIVQDKETTLTLVKAREIEHKKEADSIITSVQLLFKEASDFEDRITEVVEKNNFRLKTLTFQLDPLIQNARRIDSVYKQKLERRCSDLQKAEAEVDLLGDEVDALLSLLEKIYIALYHYSPVLQHYPGIMEVLKLVKRELSVETSYDQKTVASI